MATFRRCYNGSPSDIADLAVCIFYSGNNLFRFYDVTSGSVNLEGQDLRQLDVRFLRSHMGIVSQVGLPPVLGIRNCKIRMFLSLPDPVPLVRGTDPDPSLFS